MNFLSLLLFGTENFRAKGKRLFIHYRRSGDLEGETSRQAEQRHFNELSLQFKQPEWKSFLKEICKEICEIFAAADSAAMILESRLYVMVQDERVQRQNCY